MAAAPAARTARTVTTRRRDDDDDMDGDTDDGARHAPDGASITRRTRRT
jgi:hypothetical protein